MAELDQSRDRLVAGAPSGVSSCRPPSRAPVNASSKPATGCGSRAAAPGGAGPPRIPDPDAIGPARDHDQLRPECQPLQATASGERPGYSQAMSSMLALTTSADLIGRSISSRPRAGSPITSGLDVQVRQRS